MQFLVQIELINNYQNASFIYIHYQWTWKESDPHVSYLTSIQVQVLNLNSKPALEFTIILMAPDQPDLDIEERYK